MKRTLIIAATSILLITGCAEKGQEAPKPALEAPKSVVAPQKSTESEAKNTIEHADAKYQEAKKIKAAWRYTKKAIDDAKAALAKGEFDKSVKLAKEAYYEAEQAIVQSSEADETWRNAMPPEIKVEPKGDTKVKSKADTKSKGSK